MPDDSLSIPCPHCQATLHVPRKLAGKAGACPKCKTSITYALPAGKGSGPTPSGRALRTLCTACGQSFSSPPASAGKSIACPKCAAPVTVRGASAGKEAASDLKIRETKEKAKPREEIDRKAFNAWEVIERAKEDSYWVALWKSYLYPYQAIGALIFFVVGVPVAVAITEALCSMLLSWSGGALEGDEKIAFFSAGVTALLLAVPLGLLAFFGSFLLAVIRVSAAGRKATPVIEGMHHRSNLAAIGTWAAFYFGPAVWLGMRNTEPGQFFAWNPAAAAAALVAGILAPMGLLCAATVASHASLNLVQVVRGIAAIPARYFYLFLVVGLAAALSLALADLAGSSAAAAFHAKPPAYAWGIFCRILQGLLFIFPLVVLARCLGMLLRHGADNLPFEIDLYSEHKGGMVPQLGLALAVSLLFVPLYHDAKAYALRGKEKLAAVQHLQNMYQRLLRDGDERVWIPKDYKELEARAIQYGGGKDYLRCPMRKDVYPFYKVMPIDPPSRIRCKRFLWIYETQPTGPDGKSLNYLRADGNVAQIGNEKLLAELIEIQESYFREKLPEQQERLYRAFESKAGIISIQ